MLLDRVTDLEPGKRLRAIKNLTMAEEYLAEHFPGFPVMPGVLMLEAGIQAGSWLIRATEGFRHSLTLLREAKTVKYGRFVTPGRQLALECEWASEAGPLVTMKLRGEIDGVSALQARLTLERKNLSDGNPAAAGQDRRLKTAQRRQWEILAPLELRQSLPGTRA